MKIEDWYAIKHRLKRIPGLRYIYYPFVCYRNFKNTQQYLKTGQGKNLKKYKGLHKGKRCYLIGNGPSLKIEDLEFLRNEICFASNRIYNLYSETNWRPTYYICTDPILLQKDIEIIQAMKSNTICFIGKVNDVVPNSNIEIINNKTTFFLNPKHMKCLEFSEKIDKEIISHSTVLYIAFQIAFYMEFKEIILLGVDHNFKYTTNSNNKIIHNTDVSKNHFSKQEETNEAIVYDSNGAELDYRTAKKVAEKYGVKIYNATRGGKLEIFERIPLEKVLENNYE